MTGAEYKAWRERLGWSQKKLAEALGITTRAVQKREADQSPVNMEAEFALRFLEVENHQVWTTTEELERRDKLSHEWEKSWGTGNREKDPSLRVRPVRIYTEES